MPKPLLFSIIFFIGEIFSFFIFKLTDYSLAKNWEMKINRPTVKGILERLFLFLSLVYGIPQAFIAFGAIKIATRFTDKSSKISHDYFFIGNITSLLIAVLYLAVWRAILNI
ncbi:MAG: hypothetical protein JXB26_09915 [Candidatus Aminicenantes bacterium]|nr:hypothetical protein [Candidatus Aminicenantes bacterium]